ncbi:hypothetical protein QEN19_000045 [Hanseniaspora menglaensis]
MSKENPNFNHVSQDEFSEPHFFSQGHARSYSNGESTLQLEMMNSFLSGDVHSTVETNETAIDSQIINPIYHRSNLHKKTQSMNNVQDMMNGRISPKHHLTTGNVRPGLKSYKSGMSIKSAVSSTNDLLSNNKILPKTSFNSPFYIAVPTPPGTNANLDIYGKQSKASAATVTTTTSHMHLTSNLSSANLSEAEKALIGDNPEENTTLTTKSSSNEYPTTIIVDRFIKWKKILKALISYYREIALAQEQFARINNNIKSNMKFGTLLPNVLDNGTVVGGETTTTTATTATVANKSISDTNTMEDFAFPARPKLSARTASSSSINSNQSDDEYVNNSPSSITTTTINTGDYLSFGSGSIQDLQVILKKHHIALAKKQYDASKELETKIIPKLEDLKKDLTFKIKEIKSLHEDFKTNIKEHVAITGQLLQKFMLSLEFVENNNLTNKNMFDLMDASKKTLKAKNDPYLLKLQLDLQLKRQLLEEHYLQDSYTNLQKNGLELEKIIFLNIQKSLSKYSNLIDSQVRLTLQTLCNDLNHGILNKPPAVEWDNFVLNHPTSLINWKSNDPFPVYRKLTDIKYPHMKSAFSKCVRAGYLLKKNKLKKYTRSYFILTSNYLHEFKSSDFFKSTSSNNNDAFVNKNAKNLLTPIMSINLNYAYLAESSDEKMIIKIKDNAISGVVQESNMDTIQSASSNSSINSMRSNAPATSTSSVSKKLGKLWKKPNSSDASMKLHSASSTNIFGSSRTEVLVENDNINSSEVCFSFKFDSGGDISEQESKSLFKKWVSDVEKLCSYSTSKERAKHIHEKVVNLKLEHAQKNNLLKTKVNNSAASKFNRIVNKEEKPLHIELPAEPKKIVAPNLHNNAVMTPSIDENGNLITVNESGMIINENSAGFIPQSVQPNHLEIPQKSLFSIGNADSSPGSDSLGKASLDSSKPGASPQEIIFGVSKTSAGSSPAILTNSSNQYNATGGGGYFGIPVKKTTSNTSMTSVPKTLQSSASVARQAAGMPLSPQPQKPIFSKTASTNSVNTLKKAAAGVSAPLLSHKRITSLTSLNSVGNKQSVKSSKLFQMAEEEDYASAEETGNNTVDLNKSLYS